MEAWCRKVACLATGPGSSTDTRARLVPHTDTAVDAMERHKACAPLVNSCLRFLDAMVQGEPARVSWRRCCNLWGVGVRDVGV